MREGRVQGQHARMRGLRLRKEREAEEVFLADTHAQQEKKDDFSQPDKAKQIDSCKAFTSCARINSQGPVAQHGRAPGF